MKLAEPGHVLASPFSKRRCCRRNVPSGLTHALPRPPGMKGHAAHIWPRGQNLTRYNKFRTSRPREILGKGPFQHAGRLTLSHLLDFNVQAHRWRAEAAWCCLVPGLSSSCVTSPPPVRMLVYTRSKWAVFWSTPCEMSVHPLKQLICQPYECDHKQRAAGAGWNVCPAKKHRLYLICMMITFPVPVSESRKVSSFI